MKKLSDILGLRIVSQEEGLDIGIIRSCIVDPSSRSVVYFATEKGISLIKSKVFKSVDIEGITDDAVTISQNEKLLDINNEKEAIDLAYNGIEVIGTKVLDTKGKRLGEVININLDEQDSCRILSIEVVGADAPGKVFDIDANSIKTFGKDFLMVENEPEPTIKDDAINISEPDGVEANILVKPKKQKQHKSVLCLYISKQTQYVVGKVVNKTISTDDGEVIVNEGQVVDEDIVKKANEKRLMYDIIKNIQ